MAGDAAGSVNLEQPPRAPTASAWPPGDWGSGQWNGAPLHPPRPAAGGRHSNVAPRRPEHGAVRRSRGRMTHGVNQEQNSQPQTQSRSHRLGYNDEKWPEVMFINDYAVFIGYLSMAVMGTGILVFTWSTVVLLGGFVTMLAKKDFWCLTVITLVQTRVFDVFLNGNISYIGYSFKRLWEAALTIALPQNAFRKWSVRGLIRVLVFTIVLCPLFALYMFGLFVSPGIALWRLLQQDYGDTARDSSKANLKPALIVLYSLALLQGVLFYYRAISSLEEQRLLKLVAEAYGLGKNDKARGSISDYLREIRVGCEKDPSFARGKNLVTYAAGLMQSSSPDSYLSGARIIDTLIRLPVSMQENRHNMIDMVESAPPGDDDAARNVVRFMRIRVAQSVVESQRMLMNNMIGSASSGAIKKFVQMLDSRSQSDSREIRLRAMRIVAHFASEIRLSKIPYAIQCVSSLLSNSEATNSQHKETSIYILGKLTDDEENLRRMSNTNDLALKIIKMLVDSDGGELHIRNQNHQRWCSYIAVPGMEIIKRFTSVTKGSNNMQLPREILQSTEAISTLQTMLDCQQCKGVEELQKSVIMVLTQVTSMGTSPEGDGVKKRFINSLIAIFPDDGDHKSSVKKLAGESLAQLSQIIENSAMVLEALDGRFVDRLTQVILDKKSEYRKSAADILNHLCSHYTTNEELRFQRLKNVMTMIDGVIPKVLREVLGSRPTAEPQPQAYYTYPQPQAYYTYPQPQIYYPYQPQVYYPYPQPQVYYPGCPDNFFSFTVEQQEALLSLCVTVHARMISQDPGLATRFDQKAAEICREMAQEVMTFADLVKKAADVVADNKRRSCWTAHMGYYSSHESADSVCCIS